VLKPNDLVMGMEKIANEVVKHCQHGKQSEGSVDDLACGQFYGDNVKDWVQCGLHGTAAAISILLLFGENNHVNVAKKLIKFAKKYNAESQNADDKLNTIKQAELLTSLTFNSLAEESSYATELKNSLLAKQDQSNGAWCYFLDDVNKHSEVATCYAVIALNNIMPSNSEELLKSTKYLWERQRHFLAQSEASDIYAIAIRSLILFTLSNCKANNSGNAYTQKDLKSDIKRLWNICRPQYQSQFEVTVEYDRKHKNQYLRLPWQIYLSHALLLKDPTCFYTITFQRYLSKVNQAAQAGGYKYAHAGQYLSTRTNAILFSFLDAAKKLTPPKSLISQGIDQFSEAWSKLWVRASVIFALGFCFLTWSNQWKELLGNLNSLWGDFIGAIVINALAWINSKGRR